MTAFRSTAFLNSSQARDSRQKSNTVNLNRQIDALMRDLNKVIVDYSEKDRKKITRKAAQKIAVAARRNPGFKDSKKPHTRDKGRVTINPGNLRRSLKVLSLRKASDAYVGPQFAKKYATEYGGVGQPVDGYYAAMLWKSAAAFRNRVLVPAIRRGGPAARKILIKETEKAIESRGIRAGFKTR